jgi:hypothetical protein
MQYIQLQGQVAADLDSPLAGGFNLFIDTTDGSIKTKDSEGNLIGAGAGGGGIVETTYNGLTASLDAGSLTAGTYYKITDFRTCYDQPDYDVSGDTIQVGNYRTGSISPIIVFALDSASLASDAYQPEYPNDNIKYDVTFNQTEVTDSPAFGRIIYRKDNQGNEMDYDFREVLFKRYDAYFSEEVYEGTISVEESGSFAFITGSGTSFSSSLNLSSGSVIGVLNIGNDPIVEYYEIVSIEGDNAMVVTGSRYSFPSETRLLDANLLEGMSWKQNNILSNTASVELPTFGDINECFNNTSTNTAAYTVWNENTFLLPNNVFKGESTYRENSFANNFRNNTFNTSCDSNRVVGSFYNNIFDNDFDNNIISDNFYDNIIDCDFQNNTINGEFYNNHFGNNDGEDFDYNTINGNFSYNFYTGDNNFEYNIINGGFENNIILGEFSKNTLKGFYGNVLEDTFSDNIVGEGFDGNKTYQTFRENVIADEVYDNNFFGTFNGNTLIGNEIFENNFYSYTEYNQIGANFQTNTIGDAENIDNTNFTRNCIGTDAKGNLISGSFEDNKIGNVFVANQIGDDFNNNNIGNYFLDNDILDGFSDNFILNTFADNNIANGFKGNRIGNNFTGNTIDDDFGYGETNWRGNVIGNYFDSNNIGEYFYDNNIGDNFENNTIGDYFQYNRIETPINAIDFTEYLGNLNNVSFAATAGTDGTYTAVTGVTSGDGVNAEFTINVTADAVATIDITTSGKLYEVGDTITIASGSFGGETDLVLTVDALNATPMVYENYNKTIQKDFNGDTLLLAISSSNWYISTAIAQSID